jgi:Ig domain of plant-specific actin-binding protein
MHEKVTRAPRSVGFALGAILVVGLAAALLPSGGAARSQAPPEARGEPRIVGNAIEGRRVSAANAPWTGTAPLRFTYRWLRCDATGGGVNGVNCTGISHAFARTYVVRRADVGGRLRVRVTATNAEGSAASTSNASATVLAAPAAGAPRNTAPPTISGTPQVGQSLAAGAGSWAGAQPQTYSYRWRRCDATGGSCADISGATARTYAPTSTDEGRTLRVRVTARNVRGAASSTSVPTAVVAKAEAPSGTTISVNDVSLPNRLLIDGLSFNPLPLRSRQTFTARFHVSDSRNHSVQGALVFIVAIPFGTATTPPEAVSGADGWVTFQLTPTARVRFDRPGSIVMFVRARKASDRLIGGVSTRRLVNLGIR